jgi:dihydrolipoamide dehydrogenase
MSGDYNKKIAVVGGGPGGYAAAFYAADLGMNATLIDTEANPGGVCLYRGCIPSKALLHLASVMAEAQHAAAMGIEFGKPKIDLDKLRAFKDSVVKKNTGGTGQLAKQKGVNFLQGTAEIVDGRTLKVAKKAGGEEKLAFDAIILATGSKPTKIPSLALDSPRVWDSTSALDLPSIPKSLLVVGGGYIGLELGTVYNAIGSRVTVVEMLPGLLLPAVDRDLVNVLAKKLEKDFESILLNTKVAEMKEAKDGIRVKFDGDVKEKERTFDAVLVSVGRTPNSKIPGLEKTKAVVNKKGFIEVDPQRRTAEPTLYAIGDVAGEPMLAHKASHEARVAVEAIGGHKAVFAPRAIPAVVFTDPEIAWAGLTETQAKEQGREYKVARFPWGASGRATAIDRNDGATKLIIDPATERLLGVGIVGYGAGELIAEATLALEMDCVASDLKLTIHAHPTLSETVMEAAEVYFGQSTHFATVKRK